MLGSAGLRRLASHALRSTRRDQSSFRLASRLEPAVRALPEVVSATQFADRLDAALEAVARSPSAADAETLRSRPQVTETAITAALATTHLHTQSRIAAHGGYGFYTIGPCGEELLSTLGLAARPTDPAALHYRHLGALVARQLQRGVPLPDLLLERARGYTTSTSDPVTGGAHCSLGGDFRYDFLVTSTLASQGPQAVGRALALAHLPQDAWPSDAISVVSCGDGSVNNSEWLSALNAAEYVAHRRRACPILFVVTDNGLSISLKTAGWTDRSGVAPAAHDRRVDRRATAARPMRATDARDRCVQVGGAAAGHAPLPRRRFVSAAGPAAARPPHAATVANRRVTDT